MATGTRSFRYLATCGALVITGALGAVAASPAAASNGAVAVDCDAVAGGTQASCDYGAGKTFKVGVDATQVPAGGYQAFETKLKFHSSTLEYLPTAKPRDEVKWPDCVFAARDFTNPASQLLLGCTIGVSSGGKYSSKGSSKYKGPMMELKLNCAAHGSSDLTLVPGDTDFIDAKNHTVRPTITNAAVRCGGGANKQQSTAPATTKTKNKQAAPSCKNLTGDKLSACEKAVSSCKGLTGTARAACLYKASKSAQNLVPSSATPQSSNKSDSGPSTLIVVLLIALGVALLAGGAWILRRRLRS